MAFQFQLAQVAYPARLVGMPPPLTYAYLVPLSRKIIMKGMKTKYSHCRTCGKFFIHPKNEPRCYACLPENRKLVVRAASKRWTIAQGTGYKKTKDATFYQRHKEHIKTQVQTRYRAHRATILEQIRGYKDRKRFGGNRRLALERDQFICQVCKCSAEHVHHLDGHSNNSIDRLVSVCNSCHQRLHQGSVTLL